MSSEQLREQIRKDKWGNLSGSQMNHFIQAAFARKFQGHAHRYDRSSLYRQQMIRVWTWKPWGSYKYLEDDYLRSSEHQYEEW